MGIVPWLAASGEARGSERAVQWGVGEAVQVWGWER